MGLECGVCGKSFGHEPLCAYGPSAKVASRWTQELPTEAGFYWVVTSFDFAPEMANVSHDRDVGLFVSLPWKRDKTAIQSWTGAWWSGPLQPPESP